MKIKTKKQLNLPQLIEWVIENKKFGFTYISDNFNKVYVTDDGIIEFNGSFYRDIFTIITFEEITEDTPLSMIIECDEDSFFWVFKEITLKEMHESKCLKETTKYYKDEDEKMYLIWRDGKLVE